MFMRSIHSPHKGIYLPLLAFVFVLGLTYLPWAKGNNLDTEPNQAPRSKSSVIPSETNPNKAAIILIGALTEGDQLSFSRQSVQAVNRQVARALEQGISTIIFQFSGSGRSFEAFSDLGRDIVRLAEKKKIRTIAYVPEEALGMNMLAVFACREIIADEFAQIGRVMRYPERPPKSRKKTTIEIADEQRVANMITSLTRAGGQGRKNLDSRILLAQAMVRKRMMLYEIERDGKRKLVDQAGFEKYVQRSDQPWRMADSGTIATSYELLLLDGRRGQ